MKIAECEFARKYADEMTRYPGLTDPGESDPTPDELSEGWKRVLELESEYRPRIGPEAVEWIGTAIAEASADWSRAGYDRAGVRDRLERMIETM